MRKEIKSMAKQQIKRKTGKLFLVSLIASVISAIVGLIPIFGGIVNSFVLVPAFAIATTMIYLKISENENFEVGEIFSGFSWFWSAFKVNFLVGFFTLLWCLIPVVAIVVVSYWGRDYLSTTFFTWIYPISIILITIKYITYSMSMYVIAENPRMGALEAINESKEIIKGHKAEYFVLILSFTGWFFLAIITFGIGLIYVMPYIQATMANFYQKIKKQKVFYQTSYDDIEV